MKCTLCGYVNRDGATQCGACFGMLLTPRPGSAPVAATTIGSVAPAPRPPTGPVPCSRCQHPNEAGAVLCGGCGTMVSAVARAEALPEGFATVIPGPGTLTGMAAAANDPALFPPNVVALFEAGNRLDAHAALRKALSSDLSRRAARRQHLLDRRLWAQSGGAPTMFTFNTIGFRPYGYDDAHPDGTFILTNYLVVAFFPMFPSSSHIVVKGSRGWHFFAEVPLSELARQVRLVLVGLFVLGIGAVVVTACAGA